MSFGPDRPFGGPPRGSGEPQRPSRPPNRKTSPLTLTIFAVGILVALFVFFSNFYADILWFSQLGYAQVYWTERIAKAIIFVVAAALMAVPMWLSMRSAYKHRPVYAPTSGRPDMMSRYQAQLEPIRRFLMIGIPVVIGVFAGIAVAGQWQTVMLFINQEPYGSTDPQFNIDLSFFMFTLPFISLVNGFLISVVLLGGVAGLLTHYLYGGIRVEERGGVTIGKSARIHAAIVVAVFLILQGVNYWIGQYETLTDQSGRVAGALYKDIHAVIPARMILAIVAVLIAITFIIAAFTGRWRLPLIGTAMLVVTMIVAGGIYPFLVQEYQVRPSEQTLEREYIERNMQMTRQAYGLDDVETTLYEAKVTAESGALAAESETTNNIRLLDPNLVSAAFAQLQQFRSYYAFPAKLNVDRYEIDGTTEDTVIAAREVTIDTNSSWVNQHITYTHGYGLVAAYGNRVDPSGRPDFMLGGMPSSGPLASDETYEPRIYFGERSPEYSIVGGPEDWAPREIDRPNTGSEGDDLRYTFEGDGGPNVGNFFNRLVYALKFASTDLLLSDAVNAESQILYDRNPRERVSEVAPYLTLDSQVYPAIVDGRVKWIIDGYTTSNAFPYSQQQQLESAVTDSLTNASEIDRLSGRINYIRNSVKATVDAYDGKVELYAWDQQDPILKAWQKVFPTTVKPMSEMSGELMSHVRYPEDMFKVQREVLTTYHVTNPDTFYENKDAWAVPNDPTASSTVAQPPYYMSLKMPTQDDVSFSLTSTFIPAAAQNGGQQRNVLFGFLSANADAGDTAGKRDEDYGQLRLLELPRGTAVPGPGQAQQNFDTTSRVTQQLNLLRQGASEVLGGNLLSLPVGGGVLYVQPVYVQSSGQTSYPTLRKVLVAFGESVGFADTLGEALDQVFQGDSGAVTQEGDGSEGDGTTEGKTPEAQSDAQKLSQALADANAAIQEGQQALSNGDFAAYGAAQQKLQDALKRAMEADGSLNPEPSEGAQPPAEGSEGN